jgi:hypothetical protein
MIEDRRSSPSSGWARSPRTATMRVRKDSSQQEYRVR